MALAQPAADNPRQVGEADWDNRRALEYAPEANQLDEACAAFSKAIQLANSTSASPNNLRTLAFLNRAHVLRSLKRLDEAAADNRAALNLPALDPNTKPQLPDLSPSYNAALTESRLQGDHNDLASLPRGVQTLAGVDFDVRGLIRLNARASRNYPKEMRAIRVGQPCERLHFLHAADNARSVREGVEVGKYVVHYVDGRQVEIPLVVGKDLADMRDWWRNPERPWKHTALENKSLVIAWTGTNAASKACGRSICLFARNSDGIPSARGEVVSHQNQGALWRATVGRAAPSG
jgi:tetratricopeptide (TPR) repeat protein